jgi:hypothetical protein
MKKKLIIATVALLALSPFIYKFALFIHIQILMNQVFIGGLSAQDVLFNFILMLKGN